jgi:uncharacterized protein YggU (UPF0235/DUF167 family)
VADPLPYSIRPDGVRIAVRVTPRAHRDALDGIDREAGGGAVLRIRLSAAPSDGAANAALVALIRAETGIRRSAILLQSGATARTKILLLAGDPTDIRERLDRWIARTAD